jgi:hypothetical protein
MSQTAYSINMAEGKVGALADAGDNDIMSYIAPAAHPFGTLAVRNGTEGQCKLPALAADITTKENVLGLVLAQQAMESTSAASPQHPAGSVVPVLRKGRAYVKVDEAVAEGSAVFVRFAAGGEGPGFFGDTAGAGPDRAALDGARYVKGAAAGALAIVEVNFPA